MRWTQFLVLSMSALPAWANAPCDASTVDAQLASDGWKSSQHVLFDSAIGYEMYHRVEGEDMHQVTIVVTGGSVNIQVSIAVSPAAQQEVLTSAQVLTSSTSSAATMLAGPSGLIAGLGPITVLAIASAPSVQAPTQAPPSSNSVAIIAGAVGGGIGLLLLLAAAFFFWKRSAKSTKIDTSGTKGKDIVEA